MGVASGCGLEVSDQLQLSALPPSHRASPGQEEGGEVRRERGREEGREGEREGGREEEREGGKERGREGGRERERR